MSNKVSVELSANVQGFQKGMQDATNSAKQYETEQRKIADSLGNFKKEFGAARREVMNLAQAYSKLDAEAKKSQFGREMAKQLEEAKQKAAEMLDLQGDLNQELKNMASDTRGLDTLVEGINVLGNATSLTMGIIAQFTGKEEDAQKAVVAFTTAQSAANTVIGIYNALQPWSNTMKSVGIVKDLAATAAIKLKTAAEGKNIVATKAATVAQAAFNAVASANPYVLLATAIIGVATACYIFATKSNEAEEKEEELKKGAEAAKEAFEKQRETMGQAAASFITTASKIEHLREQYKSTNNELEKTEILKEATKEFKGLGMEVKNLHDAQKILLQDGDKVIELLKAQGEAAALTAIRTELLKNKFMELYKSGKNDFNQAYNVAEYMLGDQLDAIDKRIVKTQANISQLKKGLGVKDKTFDTKGGSKNKKDYDKGSLEDLEQQLNKMQSIIKKKNLSPIQFEKAKKEIERLTKEIQKKKIELELEPKPGSLEYINKQISEIDSKLNKLDPKIDSAEIEKLKIDKSALEQAKKDVESALKEVVITSKKFSTEGRAGSLQEASDRVSYYKQKLDIETVGSEDYNFLMKKLKEWETKEEQLKLQVEADLSNTKKGSLDWLGKKKQQYEAIFNTSVVGSKEWWSSLEQINKLTKEEQKIQLMIDVSNMSDLEKVQTTLDGFHAIDDMVGSFQSLTNAIDENASAWDIFMSAISTVESVMEGINTVVQVANTLSAIFTATKTAETAVTIADTTAKVADQAATEATEAPQLAVVATNKAAAASYLELASAMIFAAHAYIPFAGVGIAAGLITTMLAIQAATKATALSLSAFAEGGIVGGSSYHGDKVLARVDSGEMILNKHQQRNLFNLLDSSTFPQSGGTTVTVQGVIHGTDLLLVQKNTNNVRRRSGTQINF